MAAAPVSSAGVPQRDGRVPQGCGPGLRRSSCAIRGDRGGFTVSGGGFTSGGVSGGGFTVSRGGFVANGGGLTGAGEYTSAEDIHHQPAAEGGRAGENRRGLTVELTVKTLSKANSPANSLQTL
eukprot:3640381-Pyramimonas_sp.AAC.1